MLIAAICFAVFAILGGLLTLFAAGMSDNPQQSVSWALFWIPAAIAVVCLGLWLGGFHINSPISR